MKTKLTAILSSVLLVLGMSVAVVSAENTAGAATSTTTTYGFPSPAACQYAGHLARYGGMERAYPQFRHYLRAGHFCLHTINYETNPDTEIILYLTAGSGQLILATCVRGASRCTWRYQSGNRGEPAWAISFGKGPANGLDTCDMYLELWNGERYDWNIKVRPMQSSTSSGSPYVMWCEVNVGYSNDGVLYLYYPFTHINSHGYGLQCDYPFFSRAICTDHLFFRPKPLVPVQR